MTIQLKNNDIIKVDGIACQVRHMVEAGVVYVWSQSEPCFLSNDKKTYERHFALWENPVHEMKSGTVVEVEGISYILKMVAKNASDPVIFEPVN
jgi:hypothetical protein